MPYTLNRLYKEISTSTIPGSPGVPGSPGSPGVAGHWIEGPAQYLYYYGGGPPGYQEGFHYYKVFSGIVYILASQDDYGGGIVIYNYRSVEPVSEQIWVEPVAAVPPTPSVPPTAEQVNENFNIGWNSSAIGETQLSLGQGFKFRIKPGSVGAGAGISPAGSASSNGYATFVIGVIGQSGQYSIVENGVVRGTTRPFNDTTRFSMSRTATGVRLLVNGAIMAEVATTQTMKADSSLYSGGDEIWDAVLVANVDTDPDTIPSAGITGETGATSLSGAGVAIQPVKTITFGPGTERGVIGASSRSAGVVGAVLINGTLYTGGFASSISAASAEAFITRTLGPGTTLGITGAASVSASVIDYLYNFQGSADLEFPAMQAVASGPGVYQAWTGSAPDYAIYMEPMGVESINGQINPGFGVADLFMSPMSFSGSGITGGTTVSGDLEMLPMQAFGSDPEYAGANLEIGPMLVSGDDNPALDIGGYLVQEFGFTIHAYGYALRSNSLDVVLRDIFSIEAYGGGQGGGLVNFTIEASGYDTSIGEMRGVIGYA